jgi:histidyl-tRNA synthetase
VEYIGTASPLADVEVIELGYRFITAAGLTQTTLLLNSIGDQNCRPDYVAALRSYLQSRISDLSEDSVRLIDQNPLRVLDSKVDAPKLGDAPRTIDHLCEPCKEHFARVEDGLDGLGIPYQRDPRLVRGLDYYTRTAFEYIATGLDAAQNAVGGGGRYDGLAEAIGGPPTPGVGFALGIDRLILAIGEPAGPYLDAYLVSETGPEEALRVASRLRQAGVSVDFDPDGRSVKAQFRAARRLDAPVILVWKGEGTVDVLAGDERLEMPIEEVPDWLARS